MISKKIKDKLEKIGVLMDPVIADTAVPRNIRITLSEAKEKILKKEGDLSVNISTAIYLLDEISNDINMPFHARTDIWNIISELEKLKKELKE